MQDVKSDLTHLLREVGLVGLVYLVALGLEDGVQAERSS